MEKVARAKIRVYGYVQGVGFRLFAQRKALPKGLKGFVKNLADGSVEAVAEGSREDIELFISYLRTGPRSADVSDVDVQWEDYTGEYVSFSIH
ncbi:MAG TPA: acylphosphatase [Firmicutes bacterium]|nr:acylphosphatase [Candidatus Fermentithermobacillaceae bacterium]